MYLMNWHKTAHAQGLCYNDKQCELGVEITHRLHAIVRRTEGLQFRYRMSVHSGRVITDCYRISVHTGTVVTDCYRMSVHTGTVVTDCYRMSVHTRMQLLDDFKERRGCGKLQEEALDLSLWRTRSGRECRPLVTQTAE